MEGERWGCGRGGGEVEGRCDDGDWECGRGGGEIGWLVYGVRSDGLVATWSREGGVGW